MTLVTPGRRQERAAPSRIAPVAYRDAVETYARKSGRHGDIAWIDPINTWQIRLTLRSSDPILGLVQSGLSEEQLETIEVTRPGVRSYEPVELDDLGVEGLIEWLEKHDTWSGRGIYESLEDMNKQAQDANVANAAKVREDTKDEGIQLGREVRRQVLDIPFHRVGVDLESKEAE